MKDYKNAYGEKSMAKEYNDQYKSNISGSTPSEFSQDYSVKKCSAKPSKMPNIKN